MRGGELPSSLPFTDGPIELHGRETQLKVKGRTRALAAAGGALMALLAAPAAAPAATYTQYACHAPGGAAAPAEGFAGGRYGTSTGWDNSCAPGGGGGLVAYLPYVGQGARYDSGAYALWSYVVPGGSGLSVKQVRMGRGADGIGNGIRFAITDGGGAERDFCTARGGFNGTVCPGYGSGLKLNDLGRGFSVGVYCPALGECTQPFPDTRPEGRIDHVEIDLEDGAAPLITSSPMGTGLFNTSSPRAGTQLVTYTAEDAGGGLYRAILRVDGRELVNRPIDDNGGRCATPFVHPVPCRTAPANDSFSFDTTQLSDGLHQVQLVVRDATNVNQAVYGPVEITVDNVPAPAPQEGSRPTIEGSPQAGAELTAQPGRWSGADVSFSYQWLRCDADGGGCAAIGTGTGQRYTVTSRDAEQRLRVLVTGSNAEGSSSAQSDATPVIARPSDANPAPRTQDPVPAPSPAAQSPQDRGAANGAGASDRARLSAFFGRGRSSTLRTRYGRSARISGQLLGPGNDPISGASLRVLAAERMQGAQLEDVGTVRTDREGRFTYTLATGPSRLVRIGYRSHDGDAQFADTTDVLVLVRAGVTLGPRPKRLRNGSVATFRGRAAQPIPLRGVLVDLQARVGRQWRTFAVVRTARTGRFRYQHRFRNTFVATTFRFRARIHRQADYPYIVGYSRLAKLRVKP